VTTNRYQIAEVAHGYAVRDTLTGKIFTKTYTKLGNAIKRAIRENEAVKSLRYSNP
jgi:hypothetical protein